VTASAPKIHPDEGHSMREIFQQELAQVQTGLIDIAKHVQSAMTRALAAFADS
jgi:phosphate transport system protein